MSTVVKKFLFWKYKSHVHEWEEEFREFGELVTYAGITRREFSSRPITNIYWVCECGKRIDETLMGHRKG